MQTLIYIGLGSNLAQPIEQIKSARQAIRQIASAVEMGFSGLYLSPPMGPQDQPDYINAVMAVNADLSAIEFLRQLQTIEMAHGRERLKRWGARTLDLDILLYGEEQINTSELHVPHIGIVDRAFVLYPLHEIAPDLIIPGVGKLTDLLGQCPLQGLERIE